MGNEVNSVVLTTKEGEKITCNKGDDFYDILDKVNFGHKDGTKFSCVAETKIGDNSRSFVNMNLYYLDGGEFLEVRTKKEGDDAIAEVETYYYYKALSNNAFERINFARYAYKDDKAFGGTTHDGNEYKVYASDEYPLMPSVGTELADMQVRSNHPLIISTGFLSFIPYYGPSDELHIFNEFVTTEFTLYENYIVFKQTAPFLVLSLPGMSSDVLYASIFSSDCSVTKEIYCNVKTGEAELIKIYGNTCWSGAPGYAGLNQEVNILIYVHNVDVSEGKQKADKLIDYVKSNSDED